MKTLAVLPAYNEEKRIGDVISKFRPGTVDEILVINDGSTDKTGEIASALGARVLTHKSRLGVGESIKTGVRHAIDSGFEIIVIMAGNGKDDPKEIPVLVKPILENGCHYVQGSRFLSGGSHKNTPLPRILAIKVYSFIWSLLTHRKTTDITNGFRAYKTTVFNNKNINIWQEWLGTYELEYYLHYKVSQCNYSVIEVPVSKNYPSRKNYTKIRPFLDWWRIIKPLVYLTLGIKK